MKIIMDGTINQQQEDYMVAKAHVMALESEEAKIERAYIKEHGIVNPDGSIPERVYDIFDFDVFDEALTATTAIMSATGLAQNMSTAEEALKEAEENLVSFGLSIAPASVREALARGAKTNVTIRKKLIDIILRLDASTI